MTIGFAPLLQATTTWAVPGKTVSYATRQFSVQDQILDRWCWAAVAVSIANQQGLGVSQCELARDLLGVDCCASPRPAGSNQAFATDAALEHLGHLVGIFGDPTRSSLQAAMVGMVVDELAAGRPPFAQLEVGGTAHVVLVGGLGTDATGRPIVQVGDPDPLYNPTHLIADQAAIYLGGVTWTNLCVARL